MKLSDLQLNTGQLDGLPENPRYIEAEDFEQLKLRLLRMPQYLRHNQIKVEEHNIILGGNMRYRALQALAAEHAVATWTDADGVSHTHTFSDEIPDEWVAHLKDYTLEDKRRIVLLDNAQNGKDDLDRLANEWNIDEINDWGNGIPDDWNPNAEEGNEEVSAKDDNFNEAEEYIETRCQAGDIWQLGNHRLMCGDSTSKSDVAKLMNGQKVQLWLTDPPYNVDIVGGSHAISAEKRKELGKKSILNDKMSDNDFFLFLHNAFETACNVMSNGAVFYIWFASREYINFELALNSVGLQVRQQLILNKNVFVLGRQDYQWKFEPCLYGWKEGAAHYFINSRNKTNVYQLAQSLTDKGIDKMKKEDIIVLLKTVLAMPTDIINANRPSKSTDHPTMKPVELFGELIKNSSKKDDCVLDTFGGSGTTLICAEQLKRKCYIMELDPHYCDVILARWEKLTGKQATKIN